MAGHSKWHNIKHRKAAQDAKKGKVYSIHSKFIALAAQNWWDPDTNSTLAMAIEKAKKEWVPNDNIARAIKKWTWDDKSWIQISEIVYEWYSPWWIAILVNVLTDNKNRSSASIKHIFSKFWWNLWEAWTVSWMFKRKGIIIIDSSRYNYDNIEEMIFETNAEDISLEDDIIKIITKVEDLNEIVKFFEEKQIEIEEYEVDYIPENEAIVEDFDKVLRFKKMYEAFDEDEDVQSISSNEVISEKLINEVEAFIDKNTFRT